MVKKSLSILASTFALTAVVAAAPASAVVKVVPDRHDDAKARFDIHRATFNNGEHRISGKAEVDNLRYGGDQYFSITFSPRGNPDIFFTAKTRLNDDDSLTNRLTLFNDIGEVSVIPCDVTSIWQPEDDRVRVSIPRTCIDWLTGTLSMSMHLGPNAHYGTQDHVNSRYVREG